MKSDSVAEPIRHADHPARLVNATQPAFLATLVARFPQGERARGL